MPPRARRASSPSTMKCPWSCWMEKWITRNRSTDARPMARRSAPNTRADLSDGSPGAARIVTCSGYRGSTFDRVSCGIEGRPRGFRPAPFRAPPHLLATSSGNRSCRLRPDLIPRMSHLSARTASGCVAPADLIPRMFRPGSACRGYAGAPAATTLASMLPGNTTRTRSRTRTHSPQDVTNRERRPLPGLPRLPRRLGRLSRARLERHEDQDPARPRLRRVAAPIRPPTRASPRCRSTRRACGYRRRSRAPACRGRSRARAAEARWPRRRSRSCR